MNKLIVLILSFYLVTTNATAQDFRDYGNISDQETALKVCSFDKEADAIVLLDEAISTYNDDYNLITNHHVRLKILKEKGIKIANIAITYISQNDFENISYVQGETYNDNGYGAYTQAGKLDVKSLYYTKINARLGELRFSFPNVKVGSILEYKYQSLMKHYGGLEAWYFQREIPVLHSYYNLMMLPKLAFAYRIQKSNNLPVIVKPNTKEGSIYFEMNEIPGLREESYMDAATDYLQKVIFQLAAYDRGYGKTRVMSSWNDVAKELRTDPDFGSQLGKSLSGTEQFLEEVKSIPSPYEKMKKIYAYVQSNMSWNFRNSLYSFDGIKNAWSKKTGNSGEINLILINLMKAADLEVYPILVSERDHGKVVESYPFLDQFNSVLAAVVIDNKKYYLNAADKYAPVQYTPSQVLNTTGLLMNRNEGVLVKIVNDTTLYKDFNSVGITIDNNGNVKGTISVQNIDYSKVENVKKYNEKKQQNPDNYFANLIPGITISDYVVNNEGNDSLPFTQKCSFTYNLSGSGAYKFIPLKWIPGFGENPFLSDNRFSNINFGFRKSINLNLHINLSDNYTVDGLPQSVKLTKPDGTMVFLRKLFYDKEKKELACLLSLEINKSLFEPEDYGEIKEFYKKMYAYINEQVVLKAKSIP